MKKSGLERYSWSSSTFSPASQSHRVIDLDRSHRAPRKRHRVLDVDVTPRPLYHAEPGEMPARFFLEEIFPSSRSEQSTGTSSIKVPSSSFMCSRRSSCLSNIESLTMETEDRSSKLDMSLNLPSLCENEHLTLDAMLNEVVDIGLSETDTISLLDIPNTFVSEDAEAIKEKNINYAELCKNRMGNDKFIERSTQTLTGAPKNKQVQTDKIVMVDKGRTATVLDIYDSFCNHNETPESETVTNPSSTVYTSKDQEKQGEKSSSSSIASTATINSLVEMEICGNISNAEQDPLQIMLSKSFQHSLLVMERNIVANILQCKLAAYRQLPILEDPDRILTPKTNEQRKEDKESSLAPTLECLWVFGCEIIKGCTVTSMAWNKKNTDLLAVGYGEFTSRKCKLGVICCWSLKNPMWPERIFHCHSCVTSLDFSANNPYQLAVGMLDGTIAICNVQCQDNNAFFANSSECSKKHVHPVWQVTWAKEEMKILGVEHVETLISVSADGRIAKWVLCSNGLDCIDLMKLRSLHSFKEAVGIQKTDNALPTVTPGLCVAFHPLDDSVYLVGTWDGHIHMCSISNSCNFLDTYKQHISPVNYIEWSPFRPDVFLSCSSDWTIQLWKQGQFTPVLSFTQAQRAVYTIRWSPNQSTVFAAINGQQLEIWDLKSSIFQPIIVHPAAPGVKVTALLFATGTDCVLVGDSEGQVTFYQLKNFSVVEGQEVNGLEDLIHSEACR